MRRWIAVFATLAVVTPRARAEEVTLRLAGASMIAHQLAPGLLDAFGAAETASPLRPSVTAGDTGAGLEALAEGRADIAIASRRASDEERVMLLRAGFGDAAAVGNNAVAALDAFVAVVNKDNAIGILTQDQIRRLFNGQIDNWSALGGRDLPVTIYSRDPGTDAFESLKTFILGPDELAVSAIVDADKSLADAVAADPGGIGFGPLDAVGPTKPVTIALSCGITVPPTSFTVRSEEYPLLRRIYFYTDVSKTAPVRDFVRFATSAAAQPIVQRAGLIDLAPELAAPREFLPRPGLWEPAEAPHRRAVLAGITQALAGARRLSTTYGFEADGVTLDSRAVADLGRVVAWRRANAVRKLILVGYWSGPGSFDTNLALSAKRAQAVASALAAAGMAPDQVVAGGMLRPVGCDENLTRGGRVEVWVR